MKRCIILLLVLQMIFFAGCSLPLLKDKSGTPAETSVQETSNSEISNSKITNGGTSNGGTTTGNNLPVADGNSEKGKDSQKGNGISPVGNGISNDQQSVASKAVIPITLYYQDKDGYLIPLTRWVEKQQGLARTAMGGLIDGAIIREEIEYYGVYPVLPENTDILGINIKDGVAVIDFNKKLLDYKNEAAERNIIASVVYTLTDFKTIKNVRILINGYPQKKLKYGTDISGLLNRGNVFINANLSINSSSYVKADIFYFKNANEDFTYILPISVKLKNPGEGVMPQALVRQLLIGITNDKLFSAMPDGVKLLDCSYKNGVLNLDFSSKFTDYGGSSKEEGILKQIVFTAKQINGICKVKITVEGKAAQLPEGTDISEGMNIPATINDVIDVQ